MMTSKGQLRVQAIQKVFSEELGGDACLRAITDKVVAAGIFSPDTTWEHVRRVCRQALTSVDELGFPFALEVPTKVRPILTESDVLMYQYRHVVHNEEATGWPF